MYRLEIPLAVVCCFSLAASLQCYTCVFPAISLEQCVGLPIECPAGQRCLSSKAEATRGGLQLCVYEKGCANPSQCDISGEKHVLDITYNYTNTCCDKDLCNGAVPTAALCWWGMVLWLLPVILFLLG